MDIAGVVLMLAKGQPWAGAFVIPCFFIMHFDHPQSWRTAFDCCRGLYAFFSAS